jgi:hypothetical protein
LLRALLSDCSILGWPHHDNGGSVHPPRTPRTECRIVRGWQQNSAHRFRFDRLGACFNLLSRFVVGKRRQLPKRRRQGRDGKTDFPGDRG